MPEALPEVYDPVLAKNKFEYMASLMKVKVTVATKAGCRKSGLDCVADDMSLEAINKLMAHPLSKFENDILEQKREKAHSVFVAR